MNKDWYWRFLKLFLTGFIVILIPLYWHYYGLENFLWLSDVGLFLTVMSLWFNSPLFMSMAMVGVLLVELAWSVDFFGGLLFNIYTIDLADYMFNDSYPLLLRAISLFHVINPVIWVLYLMRYGYDKRAFYYFTIIYWIILLITYTTTRPEENINWVFLPYAYSSQAISPHVWVIFLSIFFPVFIFLPTHYFCKKLFKKARI